jgi:hypothetical protein
MKAYAFYGKGLFFQRFRLIREPVTVRHLFKHLKLYIRVKRLGLPKLSLDEIIRRKTKEIVDFVVLI